MTDNKPIRDISELRPRAIKELTYRFRIPSYQRGYRWERLNVEQLLDDIVESDINAPYYLQPIVVSPAPETVSCLPENERYDFDLIDGQQRLTTIFLILQALKHHKAKLDNFRKTSGMTSISLPLDNLEIGLEFEICYETRKSSLNFMNDIVGLNQDDKTDRDRIQESPDHLYMWHAYSVILEWIKGAEASKIERLAKALTMGDSYKNRVKIIWYELPDSVNDWEEFTALNIGKIPLTNSELVKALFLQSQNFCDDTERDEYAKETLVAQWDQMERELADPAFWGFLTTADASDYPTKIDLIFDLVSGKALANNPDPLYTFNYFANEWFADTKEPGEKKWGRLFLQYQRLRDWYADRSIYHLLGYLVAIDYPENALSRIFKFAHRTGSEKGYRDTARIRQMLTRLAKMSLRIPKTDKKFKDVTSFRDLRYNISDNPDSTVDRAHHWLIKRYLTLYNIMVTESAGKNLRYPFGLHNSTSGGWSLEHIHAQKSQTLNKWAQWSEWIKNHAITVEKLAKAYSSEEEIKANADRLLDRMRKFGNESQRNEFNAIAAEFTDLLEMLPGAKGLYQDEMGNMALLSRDDNSTLNNSTFDVKRRKVIEKLSTNFVPIATERVFLKAISGETTKKDTEGVNVTEKYQCDTEHLFFWGAPDREAYLNDMEVKLKNYI